MPADERPGSRHESHDDSQPNDDSQPDEHHGHAAIPKPDSNREPGGPPEPRPRQQRLFHLYRLHAADDPLPDPGLARERTSLAWTRTAISFAAVGGVVLKREIIPGLILLAVAPAIWQLGRLAYRRQDRLILLTASIVAVAVVAMVISLLR
jgi:uncharacterized membrane protein YidH (DUF202 family)